MGRARRPLPAPPGHAILEPPCHDKESLLLGYNTRNRSLILGTYADPLTDIIAYSTRYLRRSEPEVTGRNVRLAGYEVRDSAATRP